MTTDSLRQMLSDSLDGAQMVVEDGAIAFDLACTSVLQVVKKDRNRTEHRGAQGKSSLSNAFPQHHELPEVIRVVVGQQQRLAQNCLAIAPGDRGVEIDSSVGDEPLHRAQVLLERGLTRGPRLLVWRRR